MKVDLIGCLIIGSITGFIIGFIFFLVNYFIGGILFNFNECITAGFNVGLILGVLAMFVGGVVYGLMTGLTINLIFSLTLIFTTSLICLIQGCSKFLMSDFTLSLVLLVLVQAIGWTLVWCLNKSLEPPNKDIDFHKMLKEFKKRGE